MSLNDEFIAAKKRMLAQAEEEKTKKKTKKKTTRKSAEWTIENEIVAYYLYKSDSSKFLKENYSKKRKLSVRAMSMRINMYKDLASGGKPKSVGPNTMTVIERYGHLPIDELLTVCISVLRGEFGDNEKAEAKADEEVVKRKDSDGAAESAPESSDGIQVEDSSDDK